jgi:ABC-type transporter Mla subunit MlaD
MREGTRNFIVGITSATALLGLSGLMMRFGELDAWLNPKYTVTLMSDEAAGLRPGGAIEFNGVPIGGLIVYGFSLILIIRFT